LDVFLSVCLLDHDPNDHDPNDRLHHLGESVFDCLSLFS
jgi:hypothetical protein